MYFAYLVFPLMNSGVKYII